MFKRCVIKTNKAFALVTDQIYKEIPELRKVESGVAVLLRSSTFPGSLTVNENVREFCSRIHTFYFTSTFKLQADQTVREDFKAAVPKIVQEFGGKIQTSAPSFAYFQESLFSNSLILFVSRGRFVLGTWQGVYLNAHEKSSECYVHNVNVMVLPCKEKHSLTSFTASSRGSHAVNRDKVLSELCKRYSLLFVSTLHTSASLSLSIPSAKNLEPYLNRIVPARWNREFFKHNYEGDDDMPGHLKSSICGVTFVVPSQFLKSNVSAIQLNEHRDCGGWGGGHTRKISCLGLKSSFSKVISNVSTGQLTDVLCKYIKEIKFKSEASGILVISVRVVENTVQKKIAIFEYAHTHRFQIPTLRSNSLRPHSPRTS